MTVSLAIASYRFSMMMQHCGGAATETDSFGSVRFPGPSEMVTHSVCVMGPHDVAGPVPGSE